MRPPGGSSRLRSIPASHANRFKTTPASSLISTMTSASPNRRPHKNCRCCGPSTPNVSTSAKALDAQWRASMTALSRTFGIAARNFTAYPEMPDMPALVEYGVKMEQLGFDSLWVWDHVLLGVEPNFPIIEALTLLTAIAARTRKIKLGTGILVLPMRNPVILAKQLASMDLISDGRLLMGMASGWYRREFNAIGVPFEQRGKIMDESLDILKRFWTEHTVSGKFSRYDIPAGVMYPKPVQKPYPPILIGGYVDRVLKRAAVSGDGWLTYFYRPESFAKSWNKIRAFAKEA